MTLEEQREMMDEGRRRTEAASMAAAKAAAASGALHLPAVRVAALGRDRADEVFWSLQCCQAFTGKSIHWATRDRTIVSPRAGNIPRRRPVVEKFRPLNRNLLLQRLQP